MKRITLIVSTFVIILHHSSSIAAADNSALKQEAIGIVKQFGGSLKPELKKAIKAGGPAHAVSVCSELAPSIAEKLRTDSGWYINRVSLKARNPSAQPDAWGTESATTVRPATGQRRGCPEDGFFRGCGRTVSVYESPGC